MDTTTDSATTETAGVSRTIEPVFEGSQHGAHRAARNAGATPAHAAPDMAPPLGPQIPVIPATDAPHLQASMPPASHRLASAAADMLREAGQRAADGIAALRAARARRNTTATDMDADAMAAGSAPRAVRRFPMLAASMALAASVGAAAGAAGFAGTASLLRPVAAPADPSPAPLQRRELAEETKALKDAIAQVRASVGKLHDSVAGLRGSVESTGKISAAATARLNEQIGRLNDQMAKLHDGGERPVTDKTRQRAAATPSPPAANADRTPSALEKAATALERTGGVQPQQAAPEVTGSIPATVPAPPPRPQDAARKPAILDGWVLREVYDGIAVIQGRYGTIEVEPGDSIRGVGRVHDVRRQDGRWVVVTPRGLIVSR